MELYLIRHGQSRNNATMLQNIRQRVADPPLTEIGRQQAEIVARHLCEGVNPDLIIDSQFDGHANPSARRGFEITTLYCSPMHRALQTAQPIARALGLQAQVWVDVHEHGGIYEGHEDDGTLVGLPGKTRTEMAQEFPDYLLPDGIGDDGWWKGMHEPMAAAYGRAVKVAQELRSRQDTAERVALITHATFMDALLKALFHQIPNDRLFYYHYNTAITRIDFDGDGRLALRYLNRVDHLPPELLT